MKKEIFIKDRYHKRDYVHLVCVALLTFSLIVLLMNSVIKPSVISGDSMYPTVRDKDVVLVNGLDREYDRFDIVVAYSEHLNSMVIKRVIGLPGESVKIENSKIYINDEVVEEYYSLDNEFEGSNLYSGIVLDEDEYFLLGDNRNNSEDSRLLGPFSLDCIEGRVVFRLFPFNKIGKVK